MSVAGRPLRRWLNVALAISAWGLYPVSDAVAAENQLQVFPFPQPIRYNHHNDDYTVRVREPGGVWQDLYEFNVKVDLDAPQKDASMVYFNFDGQVEVAVQKNSGDFSRVQIRPTAKGIASTVKDGIVYFTLTKPENLSIEFDGDRSHNLHLFTHSVRHDLPVTPVLKTSYEIGTGQIPDMSQPVVYFGPGIYSGEMRAVSNTIIYIDGSAILKGPIQFDSVENVRLISDGLFDGAAQMRIRNSKNITIDGPIFINQPEGTMRCISSDGVQELSIRTIGAQQWSDGLGHFACQNVLIKDSFIRTSDDCITLYNHRWDVWGDTRNIVVKDTTLWADVAHAVMIGIHGNTPSQAHPNEEVLENARFTNIDVLDHDEDEPDYEGVIGLMVGDNNLVRDMTFENWRVERIEEGKLFSLQVLYNAKYNTSPGRGIENITFRNIAYSGLGSPSASLIKGYDATRGIKNITLDNVTVGGRKITGPQANILDIGAFATEIHYK